MIKKPQRKHWPVGLIDFSEGILESSGCQESLCSDPGEHMPPQTRTVESAKAR